MKRQLEQARIFHAAQSFNKFRNKKVLHIYEFKSIGTHGIALYVNGNNRRASYNAICFDNLGAEHIPKEIKKSLGNKNIIRNIYRIQA